MNEGYGDLKDWIPASIVGALPSTVQAVAGIQPTSPMPSGVPHSTIEAYRHVAWWLKQGAAGLSDYSKRYAVSNEADRYASKAAAQEGAYASLRGTLGDTPAFWWAKYWSGLSTDPGDIMRVLNQGAQYAASQNMGEVTNRLITLATYVPRATALSAGKSPGEQSADWVVSTFTFGIFSSARRFLVFAAVISLVAAGAGSLGLWKFRKPAGRIGKQGAEFGARLVGTAAKAAI